MTKIYHYVCNSISSKCTYHESIFPLVTYLLIPFLAFFSPYSSRFYLGNMVLCYNNCSSFLSATGPDISPLIIRPPQSTLNIPAQIKELQGAFDGFDLL